MLTWKVDVPGLEALELKVGECGLVLGGEMGGVRGHGPNIELCSGLVCRSSGNL